MPENPISQQISGQGFSNNPASRTLGVNQNAAPPVGPDGTRETTRPNQLGDPIHSMKGVSIGPQGAASNTGGMQEMQEAPQQMQEKQSPSSGAQIVQRALLNLGHTGYNDTMTGIEKLGNSEMNSGTLMYDELKKGLEGTKNFGGKIVDAVTGIPDALKHIANNYLVPMSESSIQDWAIGIKNKALQSAFEELEPKKSGVGKSTPENGSVGPQGKVGSSPIEAAGNWLSNALGDFEKHMQTTASGLYPSLANQIMSGIKTMTLASPYHEVAKQILGDGANVAPNWAEPKWSAALTGNIDQSTGRGAPMSLNQWGDFIRTDPAHDYASSPEAMDRVNNFSKTLNSIFRGGQ